MIVSTIYFSSKKHNSENPQTSTPSQTSNEERNIVSIPFTKGEKIGDFIVLAINPHLGSDINGNSVPAGYTISFVGTTTIAGTFIKSPFFGTNEDDPNTIAAFKVDSVDLDKIPHDRNNPNQGPADVFYFTNGPKIDSSKGIVYGQKHTIMITDYLLYAIESEGGNTASLVKIIK